MADHQPRFGAQDGEVIGDGLGVRRPDPDVDEGDAAAVLGNEVISGHLVPAPRRVAHRGARVPRAAPDHRPARARQPFVSVALFELGGGEAHELVDIAVVVGEQDVRLEVLRRRTRVVPQPGERKIRAQCVEERERQVG